MRLTTKGRFAVTAMLDLALRQENGPVTLSGVAERQRISLSYLEQLFGKLRRQELVASVRGPGGGYCLARDARSISVLGFGVHAEADYCVLSVTPHAGGLDAVLRLHGKEYALSLPLYGAFQLSNMLTAMGLLTAAGLSEEALVKLLPNLCGVPGRLEKIAAQNAAPIFIDYAHTPAALENILKTLRPHTAKRLHVVFGCGGDRDAGKRPEMGAAAAQFADVVTVTDDNPRSENAATIRAAILAKAPSANEIPDRDAAIRAAIQNLEAGDVLVVAGKGHETTQIIGNQAHPFSDADHIRKAVAA